MLKKNTLSLIILTVAFSGLAVFAELPQVEIPSWHFVPPEGAGVVNVRDYGARGDGVTDDTEAIRRAISENIDISRYRANPFIWFPNGTYLISGPIESRIQHPDIEKGAVWSAGWRSMMRLIGETRDGTVIKLADRAPGYTDPEQPKWVIATGSEGDRRDNYAGGGNRAFRHAVLNLTVDVGEGNPGAVAIDFVSNNRGAVDGVTVRAPAGSGHTGIGLTRWWPGPAIIHDVRIEGFARGIALHHYQYGMTFENIQLIGQTEIGIHNLHNVLSMRNVRFEGNVPFYRQGDSMHGMLVLLDSRINGVDAEEMAAITSRGILNLRRVTFEGFGRILDNPHDGSLSIAGDLEQPTFIASHDLGSSLHAGGGPGRSLDLPIEEVPIIRPGPDDEWVDGGTTGQSLQAAIDSGAEFIYIRPAQTIDLEETIVLRNNVRLILGLNGHLRGPNGKPAVRVENGGPEVVAMEHMYLGAGVDQASDRTFVLRHGDLGSYGVRATGRGKTHVVNVIGRGYRIGPGHRFWGRQINSEFGSDPLFSNFGGDSWILGFKMETSPTGSGDAPKSTPSLFNRGGRLEVLGGLLYTLGSRREHAPQVPAFTNERGRIAVSYRTNGRPETYYSRILRVDSFTDGRDLVTSDQIAGQGAALLSDDR